jgi:hypothetical protein
MSFDLLPLASNDIKVKTPKLIPQSLTVKTAKPTAITTIPTFPTFTHHIIPSLSTVQNPTAAATFSTVWHTKNPTNWLWFISPTQFPIQKQW